MNFINDHILTIVTFFPVLVALFVLVAPPGNKNILYSAGIVGSLVEFTLSLHLYFHFKNTGSFEFMEWKDWIPAWKIQYLMGIDGVSLLLILLTTFLTPIALIGSVSSVTSKVKPFVISILVLEGGMVGVFAALDLFLFYVFWEVMLIPMYLIIGIWGSKDRIYAALKFFIYTMAGSVLMLIAILYLYFDAGRTFNLAELYEHRLGFTAQMWIFAAFALAFAIKVPLFPLHTWLPDAHVEAPTAGSVILAGVLLKMGTYGFFRFAMPLFPDAMEVCEPYLIIISVIGIVYGALVAMVQPDMKKLIAYSSVSHMGVVMLGLFCMDKTGMAGGLYQSLSHGISTGALFLLAGQLYERTHSREIAEHGGLAKVMPWYATVFVIVSLSSIGVPLTNGFVGEFLSFAGAFQRYPALTIVGTSGVVLSAVTMLWLVRRVFFGEAKSSVGVHLRDITLRETLAVLPFLALIVWMGVYPRPFLDKMNRPIQNLLLQMEGSGDKMSGE